MHIVFPEKNHISSKRLRLNRKRTYKQSRVIPNGFWISIGDAWYNFWYKINDMQPLQGKFLYKVDLIDDYFTTMRRYRKTRTAKKVFMIETRDDIEYINTYYRKSELSWDDFTERCKIDWDKFSDRYGGIEVRNFKRLSLDIMWSNTESLITDDKIEEYMNKYMWFLSFDANSICVWDLDLVKSIKLVHTF